MKITREFIEVLAYTAVLIDEMKNVIEADTDAGVADRCALLDAANEIHSVARYRKNRQGWPWAMCWKTSEGTAP